MTKENALNYITLTTTISELNKIGQTSLAARLFEILSNDELPKPDKHNKKDDNTSSCKCFLKVRSARNILHLQFSSVHLI
jgi:hypothetical protein